MHLEPLLSLRDGGAREAGADRTSRDRTRLAFDQFEPIDVSISRASTPGQGQSCQDGIFVLLNADDKRRKGFELASLHVFEPGLKLFSGVRQPPCAETFLPGGRRSQPLGWPVEASEGV